MSHNNQWLQNAVIKNSLGFWPKETIIQDHKTCLNKLQSYKSVFSDHSGIIVLEIVNK